MKKVKSKLVLKLRFQKSNSDRNQVGLLFDDFLVDLFPVYFRCYKLPVAAELRFGKHLLDNQPVFGQLFFCVFSLSGKLFVCIFTFWHGRHLGKHFLL